MLTQRLRGFASDLLQAEPVRRPARYGGAFLLEARGVATERFGHPRPLRNIYGAGIQKAGSQWAKALFDHEFVVAATGLATFPQIVFGGRGFRNRFPAHCYVPGLYFPYPKYVEIHKQPPYRTFYIMRDPRDVVVSWYFSVRDTHPMIGPIGELREKLHALSIHDGLLLGIEFLQPQLNGMKTWIDVPEPEVGLFRLEDIRDQPEREVRRLLAHCKVELTEEALGEVLRDTSRDSLRNKDLAKRAPGSESHYRQAPSRHTAYFEDAHHEAFRALTGDLVERLGYRND
jgi:hypothetical protein